MIRNFCLAGAALAAIIPAALPTGAWAQANVPGGPGAIVSFTVSETAKSVPDRATLGAAVTSIAPTAVAALRANSAAMAELMAVAARRGIQTSDMQTGSITLAPQYDYRPQEQGQPPRLTGYQVSNNVRLTTADLAGLGGLIDALVTAGATNIDGPWFAMANRDAELDRVRAAAMAKAQARAADYARLNGYRAAELVALSEGGAPPPGPMPAMEMAVMGAAKMADVPVAPGEISDNLVLTVQFRLVR